MLLTIIILCAISILCGIFLSLILKKYKKDEEMVECCIALSSLIGAWIVIFSSVCIDLLSSMIVNKWFEMLLKLGDISV